MGRLDRMLGLVDRRRVGLVLGPSSFLGILLGTPFQLAPSANAALACTCWIALWWVTEAIPIPATSLLPVVLFPLTGVATIRGATTPYGDPVVFLLLGGFLLAIALERRNLHRRIALSVVGRVGVRTDRLLLGFMAATAFLSMWISNSATAMLMVPIGTAVVVEFAGLERVGDDEEPASAPVSVGDGAEPLVADTDTVPDERPASSFGLALMLGIAYAASIGGAATLVGSPANAVFAGVAESRLGVEVGFVDWVAFAGPLSVALLLLTWRLLLWLLRPKTVASADAAAVIDAQVDALGPVSTGERRVLAVFSLVAMGWLLRPFVLDPLVPGISDTTIAVVGGLSLFVVPGGDGSALLDWEDAGRLPWGVLLLLGAGFSLASAFQTSGLDMVVAEALSGLAGVPLAVVVLAVATVVVFLTEVTSNTATATVFMPILLSLGLSIGIPPLTLMAVAALAASFAFMLPVATPPNAVVFGSGYVTIPEMARVGLWLNLLAIVGLVVIGTLWMPVVLGGLG